MSGTRLRRNRPIAPGKPFAEVVSRESFYGGTEYVLKAGGIAMLTYRPGVNGEGESHANGYAELLNKAFSAHIGNIFREMEKGEKHEKRSTKS